jgi:hypothetical protein
MVGFFRKQYSTAAGAVSIRGGGISLTRLRETCLGIGG